MAPNTPTGPLPPITNTDGSPQPAPLQMVLNRLKRGRNTRQKGAFGKSRYNRDARGQPVAPNGFARSGDRDTRGLAQD